jgi:hypothetical protein
MKEGVSDMSNSRLFSRDAVSENVFSQLMEWIHQQIFRRCVQRHYGDWKTYRFSCWD